MSKVNFFTELFPLLEDKESIELKVQRTGDELTVLLVPKIKGKTATIVLNGTAEELNDGFMEQLIIPVDKIKGLVSNATEVKIEDADDEEEEEEEGEEKKPEAKKAAPKKAAAKKTGKVKEEAPKVEEVAETIAKGEINPEGKSTEAIEHEIEKQRIEEEEDAKLAAEQVAKEKSEAEEKRLAEEEAARLKEAFENHIKVGDELFEVRKYEDAEREYEMASKLMPDHKAAKEKFEKANKWVKQLIAAGIIKREEAAHGA
jgi:PRTRC genetic system protein E